MTGTRRAALRRWAMVLAGIAVLVSLPPAIDALPAGATGVPAPAQVLRAVRDSGDVPHSGYVESRGLLLLPDVDQLGDVARLLGETNRLRVWWGGRREWRVDTLTPVGETGEYADPAGTWSWDSEERRALRVLGDPDVRLPRAGDLLPTELGRRLAAAATPEEVAALPARRLLGRPALGLRLTPRDPRTSLARVDLWADQDTGLPIRVELTGRGETAPTITTRFLDLATERPAAERVRFTPPADVPVETTTAPDVASLADRFFGQTRLPGTLAGLTRQPRVGGGLGQVGGVATYGDGYVLLTVVPLPDRFTGPLLRALSRPPGAAVVLPSAPTVAASALRSPVLGGLVVRSPGQRGLGGFVLAGTATDAVLEQAAADLLRARR